VPVSGPRGHPQSVAERTLYDEENDGSYPIHRPMADPADEQPAEGLGAKLTTGQREDEVCGRWSRLQRHAQERAVVWSAQV